MKAASTERRSRKAVEPTSFTTDQAGVGGAGGAVDGVAAAAVPSALLALLVVLAACACACACAWSAMDMDMARAFHSTRSIIVEYWEKMITLLAGSAWAAVEQ